MTQDLTKLSKLKAIKAMRTRRAKIDAAAAMTTAKQFAQAEERMSDRTRAAQRQSMTYLSDQIAALGKSTAVHQGLAYLGQNAIWLERRAQSLNTRRASLRDKEVKARRLAEDATKQLVESQAREDVFTNVFNNLSAKQAEVSDLREEEDTLDLFKQRVTNG